MRQITLFDSGTAPLIRYELRSMHDLLARETENAEEASEDTEGDEGDEGDEF